jgi:hypothetical protein
MFHIVNKDVGDEDIMMIGFEDFAFRAPRFTSTTRVSPLSEISLRACGIPVLA